MSVCIYFSYTLWSDSTFLIEFRGSRTSIVARSRAGNACKNRGSGPSLIGPTLHLLQYRSSCETL